ncbi:MAG: hypothetical protein FWD91_04630 [Treponema sp.]|nr:hypothetical protein [Treponema sp.]
MPKKFYSYDLEKGFVEASAGFTKAEVEEFKKEVEALNQLDIAEYTSRLENCKRW